MKYKLISIHTSLGLVGYQFSVFASPTLVDNLKAKDVFPLD